MDSFIKSLENLSVNKDITSFDKELGNLIYQMDNLETNDEWNNLTVNYSKLKYIGELVDNWYIQESVKFLEILDKFMVNINMTNQKYLDEINWEEENDYHEDCLIIKRNLEASIRSTDCIEQLRVTVYAYSLLVPILEEIRNEQYIEQIEDPVFLNDFNVKRRKIN